MHTHTSEHTRAHTREHTALSSAPDPHHGAQGPRCPPPASHTRCPRGTAGATEARVAAGKPRAPWPCGPCISLTAPWKLPPETEGAHTVGSSRGNTVQRKATRALGRRMAPGGGVWARPLLSGGAIGAYWAAPGQEGTRLYPELQHRWWGQSPVHGRPTGLPLASLSPGPAQGWWLPHGAGLSRWAPSHPPSHPPTARLGLLPAHTQGETPGPFVPSPCSAVAGAARRQGEARISQVRPLG